MKSFFAVSAIVVAAFFSSGCQTNELKAYEKLKVGMDKDEVLGIMGNPTKTQRWQGKDRWTYRFYHDGAPHLREVHFENSKSVYIGDVVVPPVSAAEQDAQNEAENKALEEQFQAAKAKQRQNLGNYEEEVSGSNEIRTVPKFEPVE